jgi:hypothetical protein
MAERCLLDHPRLNIKRPTPKSEGHLIVMTEWRALKLERR